MRGDKISKQVLFLHRLSLSWSTPNDCIANIVFTPFRALWKAKLHPEEKRQNILPRTSTSRILVPRARYVALSIRQLRSIDIERDGAPALAPVLEASVQSSLAGVEALCPLVSTSYQGRNEQPTRSSCRWERSWSPIGSVSSRISLVQIREDEKSPTMFPFSLRARTLPAASSPVVSL